MLREKPAGEVAVRARSSGDRSARALIRTGRRGQREGGMREGLDRVGVLGRRVGARL